MENDNKISTDLSKKEKIHVIRSIRHADEMVSDVETGFWASSFFAGYSGLACLATIIEKGSLSNYPGLIGFTAVTGSAFLVWLAIYLKEKSSSLAEIKKIRQEKGLSKEEQKEFLKGLVLEGDSEAIALFDYFYGESKRKRL